MINLATLEGGPLDGAELKWFGDVFPADIIVATPRKLDTDRDDVMRGLTLHQYANCGSYEDDSIVRHYMGHVANKATTVSELNGMFPPKDISSKGIDP